MLAVTLAACNSDDDTAAADVATQLAAAQAAQSAAETAQAAAEAALAAINTAEAAEAVTAAAVSILTANVDTVVPAATGDTVSSGIVGTVQALQSVDSINMGAGDDTLTAIISTTVTPQLTDVETLNFSATAARTVDLSGSTGYTTVVNTGSSAVLTVSNIAAGVDLSLLNSGQAATFTVAAAAFTGAADAQKITLSNVSAGTTAMSNSVETFTINSIGGSTNTFLTSGIVPTTVNITGDTALSYAINNTSTTTVDASAMSGTLTSTWNPAAAYSYTGSTGVDTLTITGTTAVTETVNLGTGNDKVTFVASLANVDVLNGGDGTDTLSSTSLLMSGLTNATAATDNISNFETITLTNALAQDITGANIQKTGIDTYNLPGSGTFGLTMAAGAMNVNLSASLAGAFDLNDTGTLTTDSVTITNTATAVDDMGDAQNLVVTGYETVNIVANSFGGATSQDFGTIAITADTGGTSALVVTGDSPMSTTGAITAASIDASGMTGEAAGTATFTMGAAGVGSTTITGSPGEDVLLGIAAAATTINGGAGIDTITGGTAGDTISGGAGNDIIAGGTGAAATTADTITGGDGDDAITMGTGTHNVDGGAGNDSVDMAATLSTGDVIKGGEGTDILLLNANATAATAGQVSEFETLRIDNTGGATNMAVFGLNPGFSTITASAAVTTITNATASVTQLELDGGADTSIAFARLVDGAADTIDIETTATESIGSITIDDEETVTIDAADGALTITGNFVGVDMTSVTATGDNAVDLGTFSTAVSLATLDASAMTAAFTAVAAASVVAMTVTAPNTGAHAFTVTSGAGADTVTGSAGVDTLITGNGNDVITLSSGGDTVNAGGGADTITNASGTGAITGGAGGDTFTGGAGVETYVQTDVAHSVAPSSVSFAGATVAIGDSMTFANGVDLWTNFNTTTDDIINVASTTYTTVLGETVADLAASTSGGELQFGSGAWDAAAKTFTFTTAGAGPDTILFDIVDGAATNSLTTTTSSMVLQGVDTDIFTAAANLT
jgi:hypothetical protein